MTDLERWALNCLENLRDRDLLKPGDHCQEVEELTLALMKEKSNE